MFREGRSLVYYFYVIFLARGRPGVKSVRGSAQRAHVLGLPRSPLGGATRREGSAARSGPVIDRQFNVVDGGDPARSLFRTSGDGARAL